MPSRWTYEWKYLGLAVAITLVAAWVGSPACYTLYIAAIFAVLMGAAPD